MLRPILLAIAIACGCTACGGNGDAQASPSPSAEPVRVAVARQGTIHPTLSLPGAIAPMQVVAISTTVSEPAATVYVQEGDRVRAGQVLAQLDVDDLEADLQSALHTARSDLARAAQSVYTERLTFAQAPDQLHQAQSQLAQARQTLLEARRNLARDKSLVAQGYLPQLNLDEQVVVVRNDEQAETSAEAAVHSAAVNRDVTGTSSSGLQASTVDQAQEEAAAQQASAEQIRRQIERATISSPVDGVVVNRNLNPGEYPAGRQIFTIESDRMVYAILTASAVQAYEISNGDATSIVRAGMPRTQFRGRVVAILDAATAGSTNFVVKAAIPNDDDQLRAGTPVDATLQLRPISGVVVPSSAFTDDTHTHVVTVDNGVARVVNVTEIGTDGPNAVVQGLPPNAQVAEQGGSGINTGDRVAVTQ